MFREVCERYVRRDCGLRRHWDYESGEDWLLKVSIAETYSAGKEVKDI